VLTNTRRGRRRADTRSGSPISVFTFTRSGALRFRSKESAQRSPRRASASVVVPQRTSGNHPSAWSPPVDRLRLASQSVRQHLRALPNPSLGTDPLRRASLPVWRAGLCCTTRASRPASAVGVSSNVGPRRLPPQTADIAGACLPPYPPALARPSTLTPASGASGRFRGIRGQGASPP
jgi:hypothetical protein